MTRNAVLISLFLLASFLSHGQNKTDSVYIVDYKDQLVLRTFIKQKFNELKIEDDKKNRSVHYKPNALSSIGFGGNYKWLGLDVAFKNKSSEKDTEVYGRTQSFDLLANMYLRRFAIDLFFVRYKGYYLTNSDDFNAPEVIIDNDLKSGVTGASAFYIFNHKKFSFRASHLHNERQLKSAGSFIAGLYFSHSYIASDSSLVPPKFRDDFNEASLINKGDFTQIGLQFGYAHTLVLKKFYTSLALSLGIGGQTNETHNLITKEINKNTYGTSKVHTRLAAGYNSIRFQSGLQLVMDTFVLGPSDDSTFSYSVGSFRFFFTYRFKV